MSLILNLETATAVCSVALAENGTVIAFRESTEGRRHADQITLFIQECMEESGKTLRDLDAVAVSMGPGSYTGLRIGVATAKGLCYTLGISLIGINTLEIMAVGNKNQRTDTTWLCPMIDARRMEVYCALFDEQLSYQKQTAAEIINADSFNAFLKTQAIHFFGDGAAKCQALLEHQGKASFDGSFTTSARYMASLAHSKHSAPNFKSEDIAYFEPFYLKDFYSPAHSSGA